MSGQGKDFDEYVELKKKFGEVLGKDKAKDFKTLFEEEENDGEISNDEAYSEALLTSEQIDKASESDLSEDGEMLAGADNTFQKKKRKKRSGNLVESESVVTSLLPSEKFSISSSQVERAKDIQKFVSLAMVKLNKVAIQRILHLVNLYRSKTTSHSYKFGKSSLDTFFLISVKKVLSNNKVPDLFPYFLKCDVMQVNQELFKNSLVEFEHNQQEKHQCDLFQEYWDSNKPNYKPQLNELEEKYRAKHLPENSTYLYDGNEDAALEHEEEASAADADLGKESAHRPSGAKKGEKSKSSPGQASQIDKKRRYQFNINFKNQSQDFINMMYQDQTEEYDGGDREAGQPPEIIDDSDIEMDRPHMDITLANQSYTKVWPSLSSQAPLQSASELNQPQLIGESQNQPPKKIEELITPKQATEPYTQSAPLSSGALGSAKTDPKIQFQSINISAQDIEKFKTEQADKRIKKLHNDKLSFQQKQVQTKDETIIFKQVNFSQKQVPVTNWVYLFDLPYDLSDHPDVNAEIVQTIEAVYGPIKQIKLFNFREFFEGRNSEQIQQEKQEEQQGLATPEDEKEGGKTQKKKKQQGKKKKKEVQISDSPEKTNEEQKKEQDQKVKQQMQKFNRTNKILQRLENKQQGKLNKSYALIEFEQQKSKESILRPDSRLFGIKIGTGLCKTDDADHKTSLVLQNIPWGTQCRDLVSFLNKISLDSKLDVTIDLPQDLAEKIITKMYVVLRLNNFLDSLKFIDLLKNNKFESNQIFTQHSYGWLRFSVRDQIYSEVIDYQPKKSLQKEIVAQQHSVRTRINEIQQQQEKQLEEYIEYEDQIKESIKQQNVEKEVSVGASENQEKAVLDDEEGAKMHDLSLKYQKYDDDIRELLLNQP